MKFDCYQIHNDAARLIPARSQRAWMDATSDRFAYRCMPLTAANALGWELLNPAPFSATWTGGSNLDDIVFRGEGLHEGRPHIAASHFGHGVLTFHAGYLFRTDPGWGVACRGAPNWPKDGIIPLEGFVETDWLPFPFTMNWLFTRPGTVRFEKDEPFAFLSLVSVEALESVQPRLMFLNENVDLQRQYETWRDSREAFNKSLTTTNRADLKETWQKFYARGESPAGSKAGDLHRSKRSVKPLRRPDE